MFLEHISASKGKGKNQSNQNKNPGVVVSGNLSIGFFHSIVLMETADHTVKVERRGSKQEILLELFFNGRTHSINSWSFKAVQYLRKKASHVDTTYLEDICCQMKHLSCLPHT